jgi:hypothetical protein
VPRIISLLLLSYIESSVNFVSPLNAPNSTVLSSPPVILISSAQSV